MIFVVIGILILTVSFILALLSLIREQRLGEEEAEVIQVDEKIDEVSGEAVSQKIEEVSLQDADEPKVVSAVKGSDYVPFPWEGQGTAGTVESVFKEQNFNKREILGVIKIKDLVEARSSDQRLSSS